MGPNTIAPHFHSPKATHQGKLWTKTWYGFLHLRQEHSSHLCTQDGNANKGCYLSLVTYIGIVSVPDHQGYIVRRVTPPRNHPLWYDDLNLSGVYVYFPTQGRLLCLTKPDFFITRAHHLSIIVYHNLQYPYLFPKIWLQYLVVFHADRRRV